jgi:hypothetical protein
MGRPPLLHVQASGQQPRHRHLTKGVEKAAISECSVCHIPPRLCGNVERLLVLWSIHSAASADRSPPIHPAAHMSVHLCTQLSCCLSVWLSSCPDVCPFVHPAVLLPVRMSVQLSVCLSSCPSVCPCVHPAVSCGTPS